MRQGFMLRFLLMLAMVVAALVTAPNCVPLGGCTLVGCGFPLDIVFVGSSDLPGLYEVDVVTDGVAATCTIELPRGCDVVPTCTASGSWGLEVDGCSGRDASTQRIERIVFSSLAPSSVEVVVRRDSVVVGSANLKPAYSISHPNGSDCDPGCRSAREAIALTP